MTKFISVLLMNGMTIFTASPLDHPRPVGERMPPSRRSVGRDILRKC